MAVGGQRTAVGGKPDGAGGAGGGGLRSVREKKKEGGENTGSFRTPRTTPPEGAGQSLVVF